MNLLKILVTGLEILTTVSLINLGCIYDHAKTVSSIKVREAQARYEKSVALKAKEDPKVFFGDMYNPRQK
jgi:hypothetical protein